MNLTVLFKTDPALPKSLSVALPFTAKFITSNWKNSFKLLKYSNNYEWAENIRHTIFLFTSPVGVSMTYWEYNTKLSNSSWFSTLLLESMTSRWQKYPDIGKTKQLLNLIDSINPSINDNVHNCSFEWISFNRLLCEISLERSFSGKSTAAFLTSANKLT